MNKNIAVVGGGIAGLTAAYYLKKHGYTITVYEATNRVGGRMFTDIINGCVIDRGAQFLSTYYLTLMPLIKELGMQCDLLESSSWVGIVRRGKIRRISVNHTLSPILSGYLSIKEAIMFLMRLNRWKKKILSLPLDDYSAWVEFDDECCATFINKEFGATILEYLIEPQMQGFYYQTPEKTSKIQALMLLNFAIRKGNMQCLKYGMASLPKKMAATLDVKFNSPISSLVVEADGTVTIISSAGKFLADRVILATPATTSKKLFSSPNKAEKMLLQTQYSSTISIAIVTHKEWALPKHLRDVYGFLIPRKERKLIAAIGIENNKNKSSVPEGALLNIMLESQSSAVLLGKPDDEILKKIMPELELYFPKISNFIHFSHIVRWPEAEPLSLIGRSKAIKKYKETLDPNSSIILAGDYMGFPYTESAAFTGKWAAEFIAYP